MYEVAAQLLSILLAIFTIWWSLRLVRYARDLDPRDKRPQWQREVDFLARQVPTGRTFHGNAIPAHVYPDDWDCDYSYNRHTGELGQGYGP